LDPYKPIIQARREAFPLLTARRFHNIGSSPYRGNRRYGAARAPLAGPLWPTHLQHC
jgi:hypothetical protein